jgi:hypothetical protein
MVHDGICTCRNLELTCRRTSEYYDDVLGAKIKSLVYACHLAMPIPSLYLAVLIVPFYSHLVLAR